MGYATFFRHAVMVGVIAFLALVGVMTMMVGVVLHGFGVEQALFEVTGVQAITMLRDTLLDQAPVIVLVAAFWGVLFGLKEVGVRANSATTR